MGSPVRNLEPDDPPSLSTTPSSVAGAATEKEPDPIIHNFSLFIGGPVYDFFLRTGLVRLGLPNILRRVVALFVLTWVPLLVLSLRDGLAYGHRVQVPLLYDFWTYGRFVLCLPLLILAEVVIEGAVHLAVNEFVKSGLIQDAEMPDYKRVLHGMQRMRDAALPEIILLVLAFFPVFIFQHEFATPSVTTWHSTATGLTTAGWWFATVSTPIMRFMMFRWLYRYAIWAILLWRIGKLNLHLMPTHPDRAGGLDFLSLSQRRFGILFCALGCAFAGQVANRM